MAPGCTGPGTRPTTGSTATPSSTWRTRGGFANFEQPDLKAEFTFTVIGPAHWTVLSSQPAPEPEPAPGQPGAAVWRFAPTPRISTYLTIVGRRHAQACRAAMPDAGHKAGAWELLTGDPPPGFDTAMEVGRAFGRVFGRSGESATLAPYVSRYFAVLPRLWAARSDQLRLVLSQLLFPYAAASDELIAQVSGFLGGPDLDPGLVRVLVECQDGTDRIIRSRALPGGSETSIT